MKIYGTLMKSALAFFLTGSLMLGEIPAYAKSTVGLSANPIQMSETKVPTLGQHQSNDSMRSKSIVYCPFAEGFLWITPLPIRKYGPVVKYRGEWWDINYAEGKKWTDIGKGKTVGRMPVEKKYRYGLKTIQTPVSMEMDGPYALLSMSEIPINGAQPFENVYILSMNRSTIHSKGIASLFVTGGVLTKSYVFPGFFIWIEKTPNGNGAGMQAIAHMYELSANRSAYIRLSWGSRWPLNVWPHVAIQHKKIQFYIKKKGIGSYSFS